MTARKTPGCGSSTHHRATSCVARRRLLPDRSSGMKIPSMGGFACFYSERGHNWNGMQHKSALDSCLTELVGEASRHTTFAVKRWGNTVGFPSKSIVVERQFFPALLR